MKATATNYQKVLSALWGFQKKRAERRNLIASNRNYCYLMDPLLEKIWKTGKGPASPSTKNNRKKLVQTFRIVNSSLLMA